MLKTSFRMLAFTAVLLTSACVVRPVGPAFVGGPAYVRPVPGPAYAWGRPGWGGGGYGYRRY